MKKLRGSIGMAIALLAAMTLAACGSEGGGADAPEVALEIGTAAPAFSVADTNGQTHSLDQYRDRWVVLEWLNHDCPFVRKHYDNGAMQALQKKYAEQVVWLSVVSSAPGKQGHFPNDRANELTRKKGAAPHAVLVDSSGTVGRAYGARTTPHMFVIDPQGNLVYMGGIDDKPTTRAADLKTARAHVDIALQEALGGKPVSVPTSQPYGCSVKY